METPSSTRRVTGSPTLAACANSINSIISKKVGDSEKTTTKSTKKQPRDITALIDITNDSPIVGLAMGSLKTPSSAMSKKKIDNGGLFARTPGSGEALLRGQVKTLLQKVEEEAEVSKIVLENRPLFNLQGLVNSPINLVAPTPANTPQVLNLPANADDLPSLTPVPETFLIPQMIMEMKQDSVESDTLVTRSSLLLDFSEKSDSSECSSVLTYQGLVYEDTDNKREPIEDDDASIWSIQVNASSTRDEEEEGEGCLEDDNGLLDELCQGISKISFGGAKFTGKHIRFLHNSDDEIQEEIEESSPSRKHLRFCQESVDN